MSDPVNSPSHYQLFPGQEAISVIKFALTPEEFRGYLKGNALKYRLRAGQKDDAMQDLAKSDWYRARLWEMQMPVTPEEDEEWNERRADIIGQNGNNGEHYLTDPCTTAFPNKNHNWELSFEPGKLVCTQCGFFKPNT